MKKTSDKYHHLESYSKHKDLDAYMSSALKEKFGDRFIEYRKKWKLSEERKLVPDFPLLVGVESSDRCNLACTHCYRYDKKNSGTQLSFEIFKKIINEGCSYDLPCVVFGGGSEPMMHPDFMKMLELTIDGNIMDVIVGTNGTLLTYEIVDRIIEMGLTRLHISLDAATKETYKAIRGRDKLEVIEEMIMYLHRSKLSKNSALPVIRLSFVMQEKNIHEAEAFIDKWKHIADRIDLQHYIDFSNVDDLKDIQLEKMFCPMPWNRINIWANGDVSPCCTFYGKHLICGNIYNSTLKEIWEHKKIKDLRDSLISGNYYKVCKNCYGNLKKLR